MGLGTRCYVKRSSDYCKNINFLNINNCFLKFQLLFVFRSVGLGVNEGSILIEIKTIHEQC